MFAHSSRCWDFFNSSTKIKQKKNKSNKNKNINDLDFDAFFPFDFILFYIVFLFFSQSHLNIMASVWCFRLSGQIWILVTQTHTVKSFMLRDRMMKRVMRNQRLLCSIQCVYHLFLCVRVCLCLQPLQWLLPDARSLASNRQWNVFVCVRLSSLPSHTTVKKAYQNIFFPSLFVEI